MIWSTYLLCKKRKNEDTVIHRRRRGFGKHWD